MSLSAVEELKNELAFVEDQILCLDYRIRYDQKPISPVGLKTLKDDLKGKMLHKAYLVTKHTSGVNIHQSRGAYLPFTNGKLVDESTIEFLDAHFCGAEPVQYGLEYQRGTILHTRDSQRLTNATILEVQENPILPSRNQYYILTDIGNFITMTLNEVVSSYLSPTLVRMPAKKSNKIGKIKLD